jgi:opacity protein-like surface antigen
MRFFILAAMIAAPALGLSTPAAAQGFGGADRYLSLSAGYVGETDYEYTVGSFPTARVEAEFDSGYALNGALGARYGANVRGEIAVGYRDQEGQSAALFANGLSLPANPEAKLSVLTLDFNGFYDLPVSGPVRPYVGAGVGIAQFSLEDVVIDDQSSALNLQAMAGVSAQVSPRTNLFAEARYQRLGTIELETQLGASSGSDEISIDNLGVFAGVRFGF